MATTATKSMTSAGVVSVIAALVLLVNAVGVVIQIWTKEVLTASALKAEASAIKAETSAKVAELKTAEVSKDLALATASTDAKLEKLQIVANGTHTLVNSNYGASLKATLNALLAVERLTTDLNAKSLAHAAVVEAQRLYDDHINKQAVFDSGGKILAPNPTSVKEK